jgi:hypothetical protein
VVCEAVSARVPAAGVVVGSGVATVPYFIWNGSNWALSSPPPEQHQSHD